jgi:heme exporter protein D
MWILKTILIILFFTILYQDCKERLVHWFLYPAIGLFALAIQYAIVPLSSVLLNVGVNLILVLLVLLTSYLYTRIRKVSFNESFGMGDVLFFIFITCTFSVISFLVLFVFALLFSLLLHFILSKKEQEETVPLAGYMSLFFGCVYGITFFCKSTILYTV